MTCFILLFTVFLITTFRSESSDIIHKEFSFFKKESSCRNNNNLGRNLVHHQLQSTRTISTTKSIPSIIASSNEENLIISGDPKCSESILIESRELRELDDKVIVEAFRNTLFTMVATGIFGLGVLYFRGKTSSIEFLTGFLVEKSLSVDNLFVFLMLFDYFKIPFILQGRVLTYGLVGAVLMRGVMISVGVSAVTRFRWITLAFSAILMLSSIKLMAEPSEPSNNHHDNKSDDISHNLVLNLCKKLIQTTERLDGEKFFTEEEVLPNSANKKNQSIHSISNLPAQRIKKATPLLACLVCIELSDFAFAVDSIPAVLGVSKDPFIVYTSNIFAILGMRSLYILIARAVQKMRYIRPSVAAVLFFVALKMIAEYFHVEISSTVSLLCIFVILSAGVVASWLDSRHVIVR